MNLFQEWAGAMNRFHKSRICVAVAGVSASLLLAAQAYAAVEISAKPTANMTCSSGVCSPTAKRAVLNISDLDGMLASGETTIKSTHQNPDIEIDAALSWTNTNRLTLDSYHSIAFNKPVMVLAAGTLTIATNDGGTGGDYRFFGKGHVEFKDAVNGNLSINGHFYYLAKTMKNLTHLRAHGDYIAVAGNIDAKGKIYSGSPIPVFGQAVIDGLGNTISNLTINGNGLIGLVESSSQTTPVIRDLGLVSVNASLDSPSQYVGALAGQNEGLIEYSYATGQVSASGIQASAGGLVGWNASGAIVDSYSIASVSGSGEVSAVGGLVGLVEAECSPGGGQCEGSITRSHASGPVTGGDGMMVGGLVGKNYGGTITNSYATGGVEGGSNAFAGGLIGGNIDNQIDQSHPVVTDSYSTGLVSSGAGSDIGGLIGEDTAPPAITNSYWDLDTSGISDPSRGAGNMANDAGITGLTTEQFTSGLPSGFANKTWAEKTNINSGYPYLIDNPPPK